MKKEELIKKLENVKLPSTELQSHRRRLKMALLATGYPQEQWGLGRLLKGAGEIMLKGLKSPQPVWKSLVFGVVALALVAGLTWSTPSPSGQPQVVMAANTLMLVPELSKAYSSNEYLKDYDIIEFTIDGEVVAGVSKNNGGNRTLTVKLEPGELTLSEIESIGESFKNESDRQRAIDIAQADAEVQELLSKGASVKRVIEELTPYWAMIGAERLDPLLLRMTENGTIVLLERGDEHWIARVDLAEGKVKRVEKLTE